MPCRNPPESDKRHAPSPFLLRGHGAIAIGECDGFVRMPWATAGKLSACRKALILRAFRETQITHSTDIISTVASRCAPRFSTMIV